MASNNYYYLISGLPDILFDDAKSQISIEAYKAELANNLLPEDYNLIKLYFSSIDNQNLLKYLVDENAEFSNLGNLDKSDFEEVIALLKEEENNINTQIPEYFIPFIQGYYNDAPVIKDLSWENQLISLYYDYILKTKNDFVRDYFQFEMNVSNILTALNCRKYNLDVKENVIGDNEISNQLRESGAKDFGLNLLIDYFDQLVRISETDNILEKEKKIDLLKWNFIDDNTFFHYFDIEKVFGYLIKLTILERWLKLSKENGEKTFREALSKLESSYEFPEEFLLKK